MEIGGAIRKYRLLKGLKQSDLARKALISPSYLNLIEKNVRYPGIDVLSQISNSLEIPLPVLVFMASKPDQIEEITAPDIERLKSAINGFFDDLSKKQTNLDF